MLNVFLVDTFKTNKDHGLNTYIHQLSEGLKTGELSLTHVWLNSPYQKIEANSVFIPKLDTDSDQPGLAIAQFLMDKCKQVESPVFHFNWINDLPIAWHLKRLGNCTTILTKHCIPWRDLVTNHYPSFYKINQSFERGDSFQFNDPKIQREIVGYDAIDHIITVTECAKKSLTQLFKIDAAKVTKVINGLDQKHIQSSFNGNNAKLRSKYGFDAKDKLILYAGNVNPRKGVFDVVKVFGKLARKNPNIRLIIAGPGNHGGVLNLAKDNWARVTLCGSLDKQTLYDFYALADIGIVPSYIEQCSYTCIEMMHSGLPLIVSNVDGLKEMLDNECALKVKVNLQKEKVELDPKDLSAKLSFLLNNPDYAKKMGIKAKKHANEYFTAERMARETANVYQRVLKLRNTSASKAKIITPTVSVVVPCKDAAKHLQGCLDSIYKQSFTDFEIILVNDGSVDETELIIKNQKDPRVIFINNSQNIGIARSLNKAVLMARGKYIARLDADDMMHQDRLKIQIAFLEANADHGMVGSWHNVTDNAGMPIRRIETLEDSDEIKLAMLFYNPVSHPTVMIRSELAKADVYNPEFNRCEDYELWLRLARKTKMKNLPMALVSYRIHDGNTLSQHQKEMQQNVMELLSNELEKHSIKHTPQELMLHCAIGFGMGARFFNSREKILALNNWLDKIFSAKTISSSNSKAKLIKFRKHLLENCCQVDPNLK